MKKIIPYLVALFLIGSAAFGATPTKDEALQAAAAIENLEQKPDGVLDAIKVLLQFVEESPDVMAVISGDTAPWLLEKWTLDEEQTKAVRLLLLGGQMSGLVKHQLGAGKPDKNPYAGWVSALKTYQVIKPKWNFESPGAEKLLQLQSEGKLEAYAAEIEKKPMPQQ